MISTRSMGLDIGVCLGLHLGTHGCARCPVELGAGPLLVMHHAALLDGSALDALALQQNGLPTAEIDIHRFRRQRLLDQTGELIKWKVSGSS